MVSLNEIQKHIDELISEIQKLVDATEKKTAILYLILNSVSQVDIFDSLGYLELAKHMLIEKSKETIPQYVS